MEHQIEHENDEKNLKDDDQHSSSEDRIRSRSSSSVSSTSDIESAITDFTFEEQERIDRNEPGSFAIDHEQDDAHEVHLGDASTLQSPTIQTMERPADNSGYRIPSYVFASNKSNNPEWSTASNESLFSIHTGNMSFTRDQFNWLLRSGELGIYGTGDIPRSGELPPLSPRYVSTPVEPKPPVETHKEEQVPTSSQLHKEEQIPVPSHLHKAEEQIPVSSHMHKEDQEQIPASSSNALKPGEEIIAAHFKTSANTPQDKEDDLQQSSKPLVIETVDMGGGVKKDDPMSETKEKRSSVSTSPSDDIPLTNCVSHHSDASGQSFAFPVLAEIGRDKSVNSAQSHVRVDQQKKNVVVVDQEANKSPKPTKEATHTSSWWCFSCFRCWCCSNCCRSCCW